MTRRKSIPVVPLLLLTLTATFAGCQTAQSDSLGMSTAPAERAAHAQRYEANIQKFEAQDRESPTTPGVVIFLGSSSIRMWDLQSDWPNIPTRNRGFGGSHLADSIHYAQRIFAPHKPSAIFIYAGDNDIAAGKLPQQVFDDYRLLVKTIHDIHPNTAIKYLPIKPSIRRWNHWPAMNQVNLMIRDHAATRPNLAYIDTATPMLSDTGRPHISLFKDDGLHLSRKGYDLWNKIIAPHMPKP